MSDENGAYPTVIVGRSSTELSTPSRFRAEAEEEDGLQFSEICNSLRTDSKKIAYSRKLLNDWNGVPEGTDTSVESSEGCQRASKIINEEQYRIERLAIHLLDVISMDEAAIYACFTLDDTPPVES